MKNGKKCGPMDEAAEGEELDVFMKQPKKMKKKKAAKKPKKMDKVDFYTSRKGLKLE